MTMARIAMDLVGLIVPAVLIDAAWSDFRRFQIPDRDSILLVLGFFVWIVAGLVVGGWESSWAATWPVVGWHVAAGLAAFVIGAVLFALGLWGGGDAKLLAALALWTGFTGLPRLILTMAVIGGLLAVAILVWRRLPFGKTVRSKLEDADSIRAGDYVPYGIAIALAGMDWWSGAVLPRLGW